MAAFERQENLAYSTFVEWVWKSDRARGSCRAAPSPVRFAQVQLPAVAPGSVASLEVRLVDGTVMRGSSAAELALLGRALKA